MRGGKEPQEQVHASLASLGSTGGFEILCREEEELGQGLLPLKACTAETEYIKIVTAEHVCSFKLRSNLLIHTSGKTAREVWLQWLQSTA